MDDDLLAGLDRWLAEAGAAERAASEARDAPRVRRLVEAAAADDDLCSVLLALSDRSEMVVMTVEPPEMEVRGRVVALGDDFAVVRASDDDPPVFVPLRAIGSVRLVPGRPWAGAVGARETEAGMRPRRRGSLRAVLGGLAAEGPRVRVVGSAGALTGALRQVGADLAVIDAGSATEPAITFIALRRVAAVVLLDWT